MVFAPPLTRSINRGGWFSYSRNQEGLHPALIGLIIALVLGGLLFAGSKAGLFGFLTAGRDSNAQSTLNNVLSVVEAKWIGTGNSLHGPDWGYLSRPSNSNPAPFSKDNLIAGDSDIIGEIRYAECELAKTLANSEPELTFGFLEINGIARTESFFATSVYSNAWTGSRASPGATSRGQHYDGFDQSNSKDRSPIVDFVSVQVSTDCSKGPHPPRTGNPYTLGVSGSPVGSGQITTIARDNYLFSEPSDLALLDSPNIIWIDIHTGGSGSRDSIGTRGQNSDVISPPGMTVAIGNRSSSGNTFCIRRIFKGKTIGTYYQAISEIWTNSYESGAPSTTTKDWSALAFATCQVLPTSRSVPFASEVEPHLALTEGGFPEPFQD